MDVNQFQQVSELLLKKHYGLTLNDTLLHDATIVRECIKQGYRPFQIVAEHAEEADLDRADRRGFYGVPSKAPITAQDEAAALLEICRS